MKVIGYIRVSTAGQVRDGVSLKAQRHQIERWCEMSGHTLLAMFDDSGISGKSLQNRPGLNAAVELACKERCPLVVYSLSRLARSTRDAIDIGDRLGKAKADLVSVTEAIDTTTANGKLLFQLLAVLSEFERQTLRERTRFGMAHKRAMNQRISYEIPFGFDLAADQRTLVRNPKEEKVITMMVQLRKQGRTLREICAELRERKMLTKNARTAWYPGVVASILKRVA